MSGNPLPPPKHRLLLELGRGGMGTVYLAIAEGPAGFSKLKVVKQLRPDLAAEPQFLQMFLEEARLAARLNHPNVVQTFEVAFDGQRFYLEMEYLEGQSFDALLRRARKGDRPLSVAMAVWMLTQILAGLHYAHELVDVNGKPLRVVHRDVSPHNAFVTYDGAVKVLDFGIAKAADSGVDTRTGVVKGKTTYMAPEQAVRAPVDRRADLFAVGVMLWELLAGKRFWGDLSDPEIFQRLDLGVFERPREVKPETPEVLDAICMKSLARNPDDRFATAADMQIALEDWLAGAGERVGPRQVGSLMTELFAERRAAIRSEIEAQVARATAEPHTLVEVPMLGANLEPSQPTAGSGVSKEVLAALAARGRASGAHATAETEATGAATPLGRKKGGPTSGRFASAAQPEQAESTRTGRAVTTEPPPRSRIQPRTRWILLAGAATALVGASATAYRVHARAGVAAPVRCAGNLACTRANGGQPHLCIDGACVAVATDSCRVLAEPGDAEKDETLWFGASLPLTGPLADAFGRPTLHAIDVARRDFARVSRGLPSFDPAKPPRPIAVVACDDGSAPARAEEHLANELHLPAIIGFGSSKDLIPFTQSTLIPKHILGIATINTSPLLASIPTPPGEPRMLWRTIPSYSAMVSPMAAIVTELLEPPLHSAPFNEHEIRVACLRYSGSAGLGFDALTQALRFNGKSAAENGTNYREFSLGDPSSDRPADYATLLQEILAFSPHVLVGAVREDIAKSLILPLEDRWPSNLKFRPRYVTNGSLDQKSYYELFRDRPDAQKRFFSINTPASTPENVAFTFRYNEDYAPQVTRFDAPGMGYDAFYLAAYAAYAAGREPLTGAALARAIRRLVPPGKRVDVGPEPILDALSVLQEGGNIDLNGTVTTLDFDLTTGEPTANFAVICPQRDDEAKTVTGIESGVVYSAAKGHLFGTLKCPLRREH